MSLPPTKEEAPTNVPSAPTSPSVQANTIDETAAAMTFYDQPIEVPNPPRYAAEANTEAIAVAEVELVGWSLERDEDVHPACNETMLQQMRVVSHVFQLLNTRMREVEAQMEILEDQVDELEGIVRALAAELRAERGEWDLPRRRDS